MASGYRHTRTLSRMVGYEFRCEHCGKSSELLQAKIEEEYSISTSRKALNDQQSQRLQEGVDRAMESKMKRTKSAAEEGDYDDVFKGECPHCGKSQSWTLKNAQTNRNANFIVGAIVSVIVVLFLCFSRFEISMAGSIIIGAVVMLGFVLFGQIRYNKLENNAKGGGEPQKPTIFWPADETIEVQ